MPTAPYNPRRRDEEDDADVPMPDGVDEIEVDEDEPFVRWAQVGQGAGAGYAGGGGVDSALPCLPFHCLTFQCPQLLRRPAPCRQQFRRTGLLIWPRSKRLLVTAGSEMGYQILRLHSMLVSCSRP